jgi:hypothetical protein
MKTAIKDYTLANQSYLLTGLSIFILCFLLSCSKKDSKAVTPPTFNSTATIVNGVTSTTYNNVSVTPVIKFNFSTAIKQSSVSAAISFQDNAGAVIPFSTSMESSNYTIVVQPISPLKGFTSYTISVNNNLLSEQDGKLFAPVSVTFTTGMDFTDKFPIISDSALLTQVQRQTFKYFWEFGHPVSGLARERNTSGDLVTSGGSGFGIMSMIVAVHRNFINRAEALERLQKIVTFLKTKAVRVKGAFPHWLNGNTGAIMPFSAKDNGADLVETSFLMQGLLTARQYFSNADAAETTLRNDINSLWNEVQWNWFRKNNENHLYWHYSENFTWEMNHVIKGWNECLITYVLAASSPTFSIPKIVYDNGWASNGAIKNNNTYYGFRLPLGPPNGGPLFFAHYSFLGINPKQLVDPYADYLEQNRNHTLINYNYCKANPKGFAGYGDSCWGLTASDDNGSGYSAHSPNNDDGVISPTAAVSSFPYTPDESMKALKFFYYKLGDKIWKEYGFVDAFNLTDGWFANSFLAIDQGPIIVMIENHRSGLLWNLFMSCPEVRSGMTQLGFQSPHL